LENGHWNVKNISVLVW